MINKLSYPHTLIMGLGNDLRGDDGIGLHVVDYLLQNKSLPPHIDIKKMYASGVFLLSTLSQYERVIVVDSVQVPPDKVGQIWRLNAFEMNQYEFPLRISHGMGLNTVLDLGKQMGFNNPKSVVLFLVGIAAMSETHFDCSEQIDGSLIKLAPKLSDNIISELL